MPWHKNRIVIRIKVSSKTVINGGNKIATKVSSGTGMTKSTILHISRVCSMLRKTARTTGKDVTADNTTMTTTALLISQDTTEAMAARTDTAAISRILPIGMGFRMEKTMVPPTIDQDAIPVPIKSATTKEEPEVTIRPSETKTNINRCIVKVTSADISRATTARATTTLAANTILVSLSLSLTL